jgi:hypothetical protein
MLTAVSAEVAMPLAYHFGPSSHEVLRSVPPMLTFALPAPSRISRQIWSSICDHTGAVVTTMASPG